MPAPPPLPAPAPTSPVPIDDPDAFQHRLRLLMQWGRYQALVDLCVETMRTRTLPGAAQATLGIAYRRLGHVTLAIPTLTSAIELPDHDPVIILHVALWERSQAYAEMGNTLKSGMDLRSSRALCASRAEWDDCTVPRIISWFIGTRRVMHVGMTLNLGHRQWRQRWGVQSDLGDDLGGSCIVESRPSRCRCGQCYPKEAGWQPGTCRRNDPYPEGAFDFYRR